MTLMALSIPSTGTSSLKLFTEPINVKLTKDNLSLYMDSVKATAIKFARKQFKSHDEQFIDECIAEAYFWLVVLFEEEKQNLHNQDDTLAYVRMKIGYKLKEYWAPYATSTMSYLKKKGEVIPQYLEFKEHELPKENHDIECFICLQSVIRTELEKDVYDLLIKNMTNIEIAKALNKKEKKINKVLSKIKKRLKQLKNEGHANIPH